MTYEQAVKSLQEELGTMGGIIMHRVSYGGGKVYDAYLGRVCLASHMRSIKACHAVAFAKLVAMKATLAA